MTTLTIIGMVSLVLVGIWLIGFLVFLAAIYSPISLLYRSLGGTTPKNRIARRKMFYYGMFWPVTIPMNPKRFLGLMAQAALVAQVNSGAQKKVVPTQDGGTMTITTNKNKKKR